MTDAELNEAVARKLGYFTERQGQFTGIKKALLGQESVCKPLPDYCNSIAAAWEIWRKMSEKYFLTLETEAGDFGRNIVKVWKNNKTGSCWVIEDVYAHIAPRAICEAFLTLPKEK